MGKSPRWYYGITEAVGFLFIVSSMGICLNSDAVFLTAMSEGLGVGRGAVTLYTTIAGLAGSLLYPLAFQLSKRYGIKPVAIVGTLVATAACRHGSGAHDFRRLCLRGVPRLRYLLLQQKYRVHYFEPLV